MFQLNEVRQKSSQMMTGKNNLICELIIVIFLAVFFCEYIIYYIVIFQCSWPELKEETVDKSIEIAGSEENEEPVRALFIADIHLLGFGGHWFDKLRREWQMYRSFQSAIDLFNPEIIFILGDLFDEGKVSKKEFEYYVAKLNSTFKVKENMKIYFVPGNHDLGFHYDITPSLHKRFVTQLNAPPVQLVTLRGNHLVLINSMAMEGDGCFICRPAQLEIHKIANQLKCAKKVGKCTRSTTIKQYSRPIVLQHFPMYRDSDRNCFEPDEASESEKKQEFHERWDCLSREASEMIYYYLSPRVIIGGHTHHGCHIVHRQNIHEYTLPSFNWRYKNNPSFILADDVDDLIQKDLPKAFELLREMNENAVQVAHLVDEMLARVKRGELSTAKGLSFLEVKYHMLLSYLINLTYVVLRKCTGEPIEADPAIDRLVEIRTVLEKTRPIDQKLKYQVDKLVKAAVTGATSQNDPTNFKANPDNMIMKLDNDSYSSEDGNDSADEPQKKSNEKKGKYVPPKLAAVPYDGEETLEEKEQKQIERAKKRALNSSVIQELKEEYLDTPLEVIHGSARQFEATKQQKARQEYEENYFTRLPVTKAERHNSRRMTTLGNLGNELTNFGDIKALEPGASAGLSKRKRKNSKVKGKKKNAKKKRMI